MNSCQKYFPACLLVLLSQAAFAQAPNLGAASGFSVLSAGAVTCTDSVVIGDVGAGGAFTNTACTILGRMPPATNPAVAQARADFLGAYAALQSRPCDTILLSTIPASLTLSPGVYCTGAALTATGVTLTLDAGGNANAVWIFKTGAALTGTNFSVVMANDGQACNVFWAPGAGVTMTTSAIKGNILAGNATGGSITLTGGTLAGRALADVAVTMTNASVTGCAALSGGLSCKVKKNEHRGDRDDEDDDDDDDDDDDRGHKKGKKDRRHTSPFGRN